MRYSKNIITCEEAILKLKEKEPSIIKNHINDVFGSSLTVKQISLIVSREKERSQRNIFEFSNKKVRKVSDTVIHLIKRLNEESNGFITGIQLKSKIMKYLGLDISTSRCLHYRHKIIGTNFRRSRFQPKIFNEHEKAYRLAVSKTIKRIGSLNLVPTDESKTQTGQLCVYHNRIPASNPKCVGYQPASYKSINIWAHQTCCK